MSTVEEVAEAADVARDNEKDKTRVIDRLLFRLSHRTDARQILEAAQESNTEEILRIVTRAVRAEEATVTVEQVTAAPFCLRLRLSWQQRGGGTSNVTIGCQ